MNDSNQILHYIDSTGSKSFPVKARFEQDRWMDFLTRFSKSIVAVIYASYGTSLKALTTSPRSTTSPLGVAW